MTFHVGQKVVHVGWPPDLTWRERFFRWRHPEPSDDCVVGEVYTVAAVHDGVIELFEVYSPGDEFWLPGFVKTGFRPAVERKTDISIFTEMLAPSRVPEAA